MQFFFSGSTRNKGSIYRLGRWQDFNEVIGNYFGRNYRKTKQGNDESPKSRKCQSMFKIPHYKGMYYRFM